MHTSRKTLKIFERVYVYVSNKHFFLCMSPPLPKFSTSNLALFTELAGFTFPRFSDEKSITGGGADDDIGFGDSAIVTLPSRPYFLGRPLFFFAGAAIPGGAATAGAGAAAVAGAGGGAADPAASVLGAT